MPSSTRSGDEPPPAADVVLIFDTDGTLLDGRAAVVDAVAEGLESTYRHFLLPVPDISRPRIAAAIGLPTPRFFRACFEAATVPRELRNQFTAEFEVRSTRAEIAALERGETDLYDGAEETLADLCGRGHPLALFSNANALYFEAVVRVHGLERFFARTLSLENAVEARLARSKTGIVRFLKQGHGKAVVIGDRVHDIEAGRAAGARTVGCLYGFGGREEFATADWTIGAMAEILDLPLAASEEGAAGPGRSAGRSGGARQPAAG